MKSYIFCVCGGEVSLEVDQFGVGVKKEPDGYWIWVQADGTQVFIPHTVGV